MKKQLILLVLILLISLTACQQGAREDQVQTAIAETEAAKPTKTEVPPTETSTPTTTNTPEPTATRTATNTRIPTRTKTPTATEIVIEPESCTNTGAGFCEVPDWARKSGNLPVVYVDYTGGGNFAVWSVDAAGEHNDLLVNTIGNYSGLRPLDWPDDETPKYVAVEKGSGTWTITFDSLVNLIDDNMMYPGDTYTGSSDTIKLLYYDTASSITASCSKSNFVVWVIDANGHRDLLINEIGPFTGSYITGNSFIFLIECGGDWTFEID